MHDSRVKDFLKDFMQKEFFVFDKGDFLFREGDPVLGMYYVISGYVKYMKSESRGKETILSIYKPGDIVGLREGITCDVHAGRAVACSPVSAGLILKDDFKTRMECEAKLSLKVMKMLCESTDSMETKLVNIRDKPANERLAGLLVFLAENFGLDDDKRLSIELSRGDIAKLVGTTRGNISSIISAYEKSHILQMTGDSLYLTDINKLRKYAGE